MEIEDQICRHYEAELAAIAALDRRYYLNRYPSRADRCDYAARQVQWENVRSRFYAELTAFRRHGPYSSRRCRSIIRRSQR